MTEDAKPLGMYELKALDDAPPTDVVPEVNAGIVAASKPQPVDPNEPSAGHVGPPLAKE